MKADHYQIERESLLWLMASVTLALLPHTTRVPIWLTLLMGGSLIYRFLIYKGRFRPPNWIVKWGLIIVGFGLIVLHYGTFMGPEAGVALLLLTYSLKLLEMQREKDAYLIVILGYFTVATQFLYDTSLLSSLYMVGVIFVITAALIGLNQGGIQQRWRDTAKLSSIMLLQSLPLLILLFLFFPRIPPFWTVEVKSKTHHSGLSDSMSPSDVAKLSRNDALAFRADFEGSIPEMARLYWRSLVYEQFDGRTWSVRDKAYQEREAGIYWPGRVAPSWGNDSFYIGREIQYEVILEPTGKRYVPALELPSTKQPGLGLSRDLTLINRERIDQLTRFSITSYLDYQMSLTLTPLSRWVNTEITDDQNPEAKAYAQALYESVGEDPVKMIEGLLNLFANGEYRYSLSPPIAQRDIIDHLLYETKQGFCMHYAGAFVYLLRSVGIPARVVGGFQGGEINPIGRYVLVHQYDAHGWAEVWLEKRGWIRFDPTRYVAPERITEGFHQQFLERLATVGVESIFSPMAVRNVPILNELRLSLDYVNFVWDQFVVGYDQSAQQALMERYFNGLSPSQLMVVLLIGFTLVLLLLSYILFRLRPTQKRDRVDQAFAAFVARVVKRSGEASLQRQTGEAPQDYAKRVIALKPEFAEAMEAVVTLYCNSQYAKTPNQSRRSAARLIRRYPL